MDAPRVKINGLFVGGVRGMSGAIKMERSEHERAKYPDRINLDRKGLHSKFLNREQSLGVGAVLGEPFRQMIDYLLNSSTVRESNL